MKIKSFIEWSLTDNIKFSSPSIDEGSKRLGRVVSILGGWFLGLMVTMLFVIKSGLFPQGSNFISNSLVFVGAVLGIKGTFFIIRGFFWIIDGFCKPKE
jgi:hypothetical protein